MKNDKKSNDLDLFTPVVEIAHEFGKMTFEILWELIKIFYRVVLNKAPPVRKIETKELKVTKTTDHEEALGLDTNTRRPIFLKDINFKMHSFIAGASGFGKTNLINVLQANSLAQSKPIIFFDPKGDFEAQDQFKKLCKKYKRPFYMFLASSTGSIKLNPLLEGSINQVSSRIMRAFDWSEPYYKDQCQSAVNQALISLKKDGKNFSLKNVYDFLKANGNKDQASIITKIENILLSDFAPNLNGTEEDYTFKRIRDEKACLYIGLSTQGYGETAVAIGRLLLGDLLHNSFISLETEKAKLQAINNPISIYFDEFGSIVTNEFIELQNKCRSAGMELTVAVQTPADIDKVNKDLTKQILESSSNFFILKQRLEDSATFFSETIGTITGTKKTHVIDDDRVQSMGTVREVNELIVHPDLIKNLRIGQCILLRHSPTCVNLLNVRNIKWDALKELRAIKNEIGGWQ